MRSISFLAAFCGLCFVAAGQGAEPCRDAYDVVTPKVPDRLCRVTLNHQELGGEIDRRLQNLVYKHFMVLDLEANWLEHFRHRRDRGDQQFVYYGVGKVLDAGSLFAAYTGDPAVAARTQYISDELVKSRDEDGYMGFWSVEPGHRQDQINWILHEQEYINLAFVRNYRCTGNPQALANARAMADHILQTFPTPQNPVCDAGEICTAGLPEGMLELYRVTGDKRYFDFAADVPHGNNRGEIQLASLRSWEQDFSRRPCHVYVMLARCYAQTELYRLTGEDDLLRMSRFMRNELLKQTAGGMLVTGSCSEGEHFTYNQNGRGAIGESCVTAYVLRWMDSLMRLEGDMRYGDVIERTVYNALFAANSPDGRWIRYFTPFTGDRTYDTRDSFCCCGNYRRAVAELPQKVYYRTPNGGIAVNLFTNSQKSFDVQGTVVTLRQETAYPNDGEVTLTIAAKSNATFPLQIRTPRWCREITFRVNQEAPVKVDPQAQELGRYELNREWKDGDVIRISMPMEWRFVRGRGVQDGRVTLLRGPIVYCIGKDHNAELLAKCPEPRNLVIDPSSLGAPISDATLRPDGLRVTAKAWLNADRTGEVVPVVLTEFIDPSGQDVYFQVPDLADTNPVPLVDDELVSWPNEYANAHILDAYYGPRMSGDLADLFELRGDVVADLAANYVNPAGKSNVSAEFPDSAGGKWELINCRNGGLLSTAAPEDVKRLNSQFKAFGTPLGYAYGLEGQADELGFVSDYSPSDRQEDVWRVHYTENMFDQVVAAGERREFLYTHPVADAASYSIFRWSPAKELKGKEIVLSGTLFSNLGNGIECRIINWQDSQSYDVIGTFNTKDLTVSKCGTSSFNVPIAVGKVGEHIDFVLHNAGNHVCDATAIRLRVLTNVRKPVAQTNVTKILQSQYHNRLVTPLESYKSLFGDVAPGQEKTLKVKVSYWQQGIVKYLEFASDAPLDLTSSKP
jgi:DUF1680 family protein